MAVRDRLRFEGNSKTDERAARSASRLALEEASDYAFCGAEVNFMGTTRASSPPFVVLQSTVAAAVAASSSFSSRAVFGLFWRPNGSLSRRASPPNRRRCEGVSAPMRRIGEKTASVSSWSVFSTPAAVVADVVGEAVLRLRRRLERSDGTRPPFWFARGSGEIRRRHPSKGGIVRRRSPS